MTDYDAVVAFAVQGFVYRLRWPNEGECYLEMTRLLPDGKIGDDWTPIPDTPQSRQVIEALQQARKAVGIMADRWVE